MSEASQAVKQVSRVGIVWGVLTLVLGMLAIAAPLQSGIAVSTLVAILAS